MKRIAIFASGSGTNAEKIMQHFESSTLAEVGLVVCNKPGAKVLERAANYKIPTFVSNSKAEFQSTRFVAFLKDAYQIDVIVLAGYLWLIHPNIIEAFPKSILNIHPDLLPDYGGKGMYGDKVHKAVIANGEKESGVTIHYVNEHYDEGNIVYQESFELTPGESPESLATKIHQLEHRIYPHVIEEFIANKN